MRTQGYGSLVLVLVIGAACAAGGGTRPADVRPGIEVLLADSAHLVRDRRVGILTNQNGVDRSGRRDIDLLRSAGIQVTAIFSPEHGFRGVLDRENIEHTTDSATGLTIYSLYGTVRAPTPEMWKDVDVLLVDLQDIGARPYTYISATLLCLRSAVEAGRTVIVLDRPNPIGGVLVQGPVLDSAFSSWVGMLRVPLRHGMTLGELARLGNQELQIGASLSVIPAAGWRRADWYDATGIPWVRPSPSMPDLESATHYPGLVMLERTNLSVGRGTPLAFQVVAAPWLEPARLIDRLTAIPGVTLSDTLVFPESPTDSKYGGQELPAVRLRVTDRDRYDPVRATVELLAAIRSLHGDSLRFTDPRGFDERAGTNQVRAGIEAGQTPNRIWSAWYSGLDEFVKRRERYLLYR